MKSLTRKVGKFRRLTWQDRRTFAVAVALLPLFWLRLRYGRNPAATNMLASADRPHPPSPSEAPPLGDSEPTVEIAALRHQAELVNQAAWQVLPEGNCLTRSIYLQWWLRRRGVRTDLRIGVQRRDGKIHAHAWVEYLGNSLNDSPRVGSDFSPLVQRSRGEPDYPTR